MQARMNHPVMVVPDAMQALLALTKATHKALGKVVNAELVHLRASQINGCSVCVDMHSRELKAKGESDERIWAVGAWRETPFFTETELAGLLLAIASINVWNRLNAATRQIVGSIPG
jgi:AhpD family alkylhydroperoxidase